MTSIQKKMLRYVTIEVEIGLYCTDINELESINILMYIIILFKLVIYR